MSKTKVAVIGCGTIATRAHIPAYMANPNVEIKYFCDIIYSRAEEAAKNNNIGQAIEDYKIALDDPEVLAISVCTPNNCHSTITIDALKKGKHVLCEKPAARTFSEALEMQKAQSKYNKVLNIGVVNRFNDGVNKIKKMIDGGDLGEVYNVYVSFRSHRSIPGLGGDFTNIDVAGGGVLIDWGVHFLDIVMYCLGDPQPVSASGEKFSKLGKDMSDYTYTNMWAGPPNLNGVYNVEDSITGMVRTEGPVITFNGAWAQNIGVNEMYIDFMGTKAGIRLYYGKDFKLYSTQNGMLTETIFQYSSTDMFQNEIDAFIKCIKTNEKMPSNIDTVIITAKLMDAIYRSTNEHREISL